MKRNKSEEGAVLLLLIIMMSAVVLIVASLLRFNTQNIRFAAIEVEQEQALYLAEGVADSLDYHLLQNLPDGYDEFNIRDEIDVFVDNNQSDSNTRRTGIKDFLINTGSTYIGETSINDISITFSNSDSGASSYLPSGDPLSIGIDIDVSGGNTSRKITVYFEFPTETSSTERVNSFIRSKELNYSN